MNEVPPSIPAKEATIDRQRGFQNRGYGVVVRFRTVWCPAQSHRLTKARTGVHRPEAIDKSGGNVAVLSFFRVFEVHGENFSLRIQTIERGPQTQRNPNQRRICTCPIIR